MYSAKDLKVITSGYFTLIEFKPTYCVLKSICTGHTWRIAKKQANWFVLWHKHHDKDNFHIQYGGLEKFEDCLLEVVSHDDYQRNGRRAVMLPAHGFFEDIMDLYKAG